MGATGACWFPAGKDLKNKFNLCNTSMDIQAAYFVSSKCCSSCFSGNLYIEVILMYLLLVFSYGFKAHRNGVIRDLSFPVLVNCFQFGQMLRNSIDLQKNHLWFPCYVLWFICFLAHDFCSVIISPFLLISGLFFSCLKYKIKSVTWSIISSAILMLIV